MGTDERKIKMKNLEEQNEIEKCLMFCNNFRESSPCYFLRISLYLILLRKEMIQATFVSSRDNDLVTRSPWNVEF